MEKKPGYEKKLLSTLGNRKTQILKMIILLLAGSLLVTVNTFGYDFSDVRNSLVKDLQKWQGYASRNKIAIVYNNESRDQVKRTYNLVNLKKDLSRELLKSFDVADPIIVQEIINSNKLEYQQIADSKSVLGQFADRANSIHVLLVDFQPKSNTLVADIKLINRDYSRISTVKTEVLPDDQNKAPYQSNQVVAQTSQPSSSVYDSFDINFGSRKFPEGHNDSWIYFSPTALLNPETNAIHLAFWFKDLGDVDVQTVRFRYELKFLELLQLGVQSYAIAEKINSDADKPNTSKESGHHSTYVSLKYLIVNDTVLPFNFSLGIRRRILWDPDNTDFRSRDQVNKTTDPDGYEKAKDRDEQNDKYNILTLQAMVTGKLESIGILYNVYVDSQTIGTGIKFVLTPDIKLFADNVYYYYEKPNVVSDSAAGIQFYNRYGSAELMYQFETQQIQLGFNLDF